MGILREENGVYVTPYTKEEFHMICTFASLHNMRTKDREIDEYNVDRIYAELLSPSTNFYWRTDEVVDFGKTIPSGDIKDFLIKYGEIDVDLFAMRTVEVTECLSVSNMDIPDHLDLYDYIEIEDFMEEYASMHPRQWAAENEEPQDVYDTTLEVSLSWIRFCQNNTIGYENVLPILEKEVA